MALHEERLDRELMWSAPYGELRVLTRMWLDTYRIYQGLRRYEQSPILSKYADTKVIDHQESLLGDERDRLERAIEELTKQTNEWAWAKDVVGLGALTLGKLLGMVGCPAARQYSSTFRKHCGYGVTNSRADKPTRGQRLPYNNLAKSQVWVIVGQFLKAYPISPNLYGEVFYLWRQRYSETRPDWTKGHIVLASWRKVASLFLSHLWEVSRRAHGLPAYEPYSIALLEHVSYIPPEAALHPRKRRPEVVDAISNILRELPDEPDEEVRQLTETLVQSFINRIEAR